MTIPVVQVNWGCRDFCSAVGTNEIDYPEGTDPVRVQSQAHKEADRRDREAVTSKAGRDVLVRFKYKPE